MSVLSKKDLELIPLDKNKISSLSSHILLLKLKNYNFELVVLNLGKFFENSEAIFGEHNK
jgi:hypothetical protein